MLVYLCSTGAEQAATFIYLMHDGQVKIYEKFGVHPTVIENQ